MRFPGIRKLEDGLHYWKPYSVQDPGHYFLEIKLFRFQVSIWDGVVLANKLAEELDRESERTDL